MIRKSMLYKTGVEYGDYTLNHIQGCSHGCKYPCYAMMMAKRFGKVKSYKDWCEPKIVLNTLEILDKEIPKLKAKIKSVHLCFTTDPFMYGRDDIQTLSLAVIRKLNDSDTKTTVLTKGILPIELSEMSNNNEYGITLVSLDEHYRESFEPGAASVKQRLQALKALHDKGCKIWVSIEPYPTPNIIEQDLKKILEAVIFANKIIFGRTNYSKLASAYKMHKQFYNEQSKIVSEFCEQRNIDYHIKIGTVTEENKQKS